MLSHHFFQKREAIAFFSKARALSVSFSTSVSTMEWSQMAHHDFSARILRWSNRFWILFQWWIYIENVPIPISLKILKESHEILQWMNFINKCWKKWMFTNILVKPQRCKEVTHTNSNHLSLHPFFKSNRKILCLHNQNWRGSNTCIFY